MKFKKIIILFALHLLFICALSANDKPYVLMVSFDGFRYDYLDRHITPNLNQIADSGVVAASLKPVFPVSTFPNHMSIITGLYPENHGIIANNFIDPFTDKKYNLYDEDERQNGSWYLGEAFWETAKRSGIKSASLFWPGSDIEPEERQPDYWLEYEKDMPYEERIDKVMEWLSLEEDRPNFITLYFDNPDEYGHEYGSNSSELNDMIIEMDIMAGKILYKLDSMRMRDSVNIIFLSDHGMFNIDTNYIDINSLLDVNNCIVQNYGAYMMVSPGKKGNYSEKAVDELYRQLKKQENHYRAYTKENIPDYYHFSKNPFIAPIIVIPDLGYLLIDKERSHYASLKAAHGFDNNDINMHGFFIAKGPLFKKNLHTGTIQNIDIYPLLCDIFGIRCSNKDGDLNRIKFILNNK